MIIHIVVFKLINTEIIAIENIKQKLDTLKNLSFPVVLEIIEKSNILKSYIDGDLVLFSKFKNEKDLELYMKDPKHLEVIENTSHNIQEKYILDFKSP